MLRHFVLWLALSAAIFFGGSGKALAQFSRSASIDLSSSSYGSGSGSFEYNPISRQFTFSGSFFGYSGYGSSSYVRNNDNSISVRAFNLITTYEILTVPAFSMGRSGSSYFGSFYSSLLGETVSVLIDDMNDSDLDDIPDLSDGTNNAPIPVITSQPQSLSIALGGSPTLSVTASSRAGDNFFYQWKKNGVNMEGENGSTLSFSEIAQADGGQYSVYIENEYGSVSSSTATLTVVVPPAFAIQTTITLRGNLATAFRYVPTVTGSAANFTASSLPPGLVINRTTGIITGTPSSAGYFSSTITASNSAGTATLSFTFTIPGSLLRIPFSDNFSVAVANRYLPFNVYSPASLSVRNGVASFDSPADGDNGATAGFVLNLPLPLASSWDIAADVNLPNGWETTEAEIGLSLEPIFGPSDTVETHSIRGNYLNLMLNRDTQPSEEGANNVRRNVYVGDVGQEDLQEVLVDDSFVTARLRLVYLSGNKTLTAWVQTDSNTGWVRLGSPLDFNPGNADSLAQKWSLSSGSSLMLVLYGFAEGGTGGRTISLDNLSVTTPVAPVITSTSNLNGQAGTPFSYQISAANNPISYGASNLPEGVEVNSSTGVISGTPSAAGVTSTVVLSAVNPAGTGTRTNTAVILPAFTGASSVTGFVNDSAFTHPVTVGTHSFGSNLKYAASGLPTGMTINTTSGLISGKPTVAGAFPATVTITALGASASQRVDFRIQGAAGGAFSLTLNPRPTNVLNLPVGLSYNKVSGVISGTPQGWGAFTATGQMSNGATSNISIPVMPSVPVIGGPTNWNAQVGQETRYQVVAGGFGREWAGWDDFSSSSPNVNLWKLSHGSPAISVSQNYRQTNGYATFFSTKTSGESSGMIFWKQPLPTWQSWRILMSARFESSSFRVSGGGSVEGLIGVMPNVNSPRSKFVMNLAVDSDSLYAVPNWGVNSFSAGATDGEIRVNHGLASTVLSLDYDAGQKTIAGSYADSAGPSEAIPAHTLSTTNWQGLNQFVLVMGGYSENATIPLETLQMDNFLCLPDPNDLEYRAYLVGTNGTALTNGMGDRYLPEGLYCDSQTGAIQGQLEEGVVGGIYRVWVQAEYKTNNLPVQDMPLVKGGKTVAITLLPAFMGASSVTGFVNDSAFTHPVTVGTHNFGANLKFSATGLPTGMNINTTSGVISGKPTVAGAFPATVTITANGASASQRIDFTIKGAAGGAFSLTLNPRPTNVLNLPAGLSYNKTTGVISGTPQVWGDFTSTGQLSNGTMTDINIPIMPSVPVIAGPTNWNAQVGQETRYQIVAGGFGREWAGWDDFNGSSPSTNWLSSGPLAAFRTNATTKSGLGNYQGRLSLTHGGTTNQVGSGYLVWARTIPVGARWTAIVESGISTNLNLVRRTNNLGQPTNGQWISTKLNLLRAGSEVAEGNRLTAELDRSPEEGNILLARINGGGEELGKLSAPGDSAALALSYDEVGTISSEGFPEPPTWQTLHSLSVGDMGLTSSNQWRLAVGGFSEYFRIEQPGLVWWDNFVLLPDPGVITYRAYLVDSNGVALTDLDGNPYLPEGLDLFDNTAGAISGIPSDSLVGGTYRIRVEAEYNSPFLPIQGLPPVMGGKTVPLTLLPAFTGASSVTGFVNDSAFTHPVRVGTHSFGANLKYAASGLPTGMSINTTSGVISGKPTVAGAFPATATITANGVSASQRIDFFVPAAVGGQFNFTLTPRPANVTGLPSGLIYNRTTGVISGIPQIAGNFEAIGQLTNGATTNIALTILPSVPVIVSPTNALAKLGEEFFHPIVPGGPGREWAGFDSFETTTSTNWATSTNQRNAGLIRSGGVAGRLVYRSGGTTNSTERAAQFWKHTVPGHVSWMAFVDTALTASNLPGAFEFGMAAVQIEGKTVAPLATPPQIRSMVWNRFFQSGFSASQSTKFLFDGLNWMDLFAGRTDVPGFSGNELGFANGYTIYGGGLSIISNQVVYRSTAPGSFGMLPPLRIGVGHSWIAKARVKMGDDWSISHADISLGVMKAPHSVTPRVANLSLSQMTAAATNRYVVKIGRNMRDGNYFGYHGYAAGGYDDDGPNQITTSKMGWLKLSYDASARTLSSSYDPDDPGGETTLKVESLDWDVAGTLGARWGLDSNSSFWIFLSGGTEGSGNGNSPSRMAIDWLSVDSQNNDFLFSQEGATEGVCALGYDANAKEITSFRWDFGEERMVEMGRLSTADWQIGTNSSFALFLSGMSLSQGLTASTTCAVFDNFVLMPWKENFTYELVSGALPDGVSLSGNGYLAGNPTSLGTYLVTFRVVGAGGSTTHNLQIVVQR